MTVDLFDISAALKRIEQLSEKAAQNRIQIAAAKREASEEVESAYQRAVEQVDVAVEQMLSDPINAFSLRLASQDSVESHSVEVVTDIFTGQMGIQPTAQRVVVSPTEFRDGSCHIEVLSLFSTTLCCLIGLRVTATDPNTHITVELVDASDPQDSRVVLVDVDNDEYYHPISSDLHETLIPNRPRRGLVCFPMIRHGTSRLELYLTGLGPGLEIFPVRVCFAIETPDLSAVDRKTRRGQSPETIRQILHNALKAERNRLLKLIDKKHPPCRAVRS
jgi:hypothetical protein